MAPLKTAIKKASTAKLQKPMKRTKLAKPAKSTTRTHASKPLKGSRAVFAGKVFAMSGELPSQIDSWITHHGGHVGKLITDETTHLICTMENFKNKVTLVKDAIKLGNAKCKIIDWEFIEDSLHPRPRRISEYPYLLKNIVSGKKILRPTVHLKKKVVKKSSKGSEEVMVPWFHHVYVDKTGFEYKVVLKRIISSPKIKKLEEVFTIYIFESNPLPATYLVAKTYKLTNKPVVLYHDEGVGKEFQKAFDEFKAIFETKTGISWDQRLDRLEQDKEKYSYEPPGACKPLGLLPPGWEEPIQDFVESVHGTVTASRAELGDACHAAS